MNPTAWLPDDTLVTWAARNGIPVGAVTNVATGLLSIGGREIGDTGSRNVPALLINSWTNNGGSVIRLRRVGAICSLEVDLAGGVANTQFMTLPNGFKGTFNLTVANLLSSTRTGYVVGDAAHCGFPNTGSVYWSAMWFTTDAWPTSLPGSAL